MKNTQKTTAVDTHGTVYMALREAREWLAACRVNPAKSIVLVAQQVLTDAIEAVNNAIATRIQAGHRAAVRAYRKLLTELAWHLKYLNELEATL